MLPLMIDVKNKPIVVIGGGKIACRRISVLLKQGAHIKVVSPSVHADIKELSEAKQLKWVQKKVDKEDLAGAFLIVAATDHKDVNEWAAMAANQNQLVNIAGQAELGNVQMPSFHQKGRLTVAVSTDGASPTLAKDLCQQFFDQFDDEFFLKLDQLFNERQQIKASPLSHDEKKDILSSLARKSINS
jgi:precorrin-2 dehydrogenase/sirohydrochlorin ferrochelatase